MPEHSLFETILSSTIHDMKNSLSQLLAQLDEVSYHLKLEDKDQLAFSNLRYEASKINLSLMQLLSLYKLEKKQVNIQIGEVEVIDFIEDCVAAHSLMASNKKIRIDVDCDESLIWFFDSNFVGIVINNILGNSIRYAKNRVLVTAKMIDNQHIIQIDDDGEGYPESMLKQPGQYIKHVDFKTGSTSLGLFFSEVIADSHIRAGQKGLIRLDNKQLLDGGCFQLILP